MRRGEKAPPVYRASRVGMERTIPFKRPEVDSLPHEPCPVEGCGKVRPYDIVNGEGHFLIRIPDPRSKNCGLWFHSYGCVSRFAIVQELRS